MRTSFQKGSSAIASWLVIMMALAMFTFGQTSKGILAGTVTDNSGAVIVGVQVTATSLDTGETRTVTSGPTGAFRIEAVNPGKYQVVFSSQGFKSETVTNLQVAGSVVTPVDVKLQIPGTTTEQVTVLAENNQIETDNGQLSGTVNEKELNELPIGSLNPIELVLTEPGVINNNGRGGTNGVGFAVNGGRPQSNNFLIDGQDNNDNAIEGQAFQPQNPFAVQEVAILTNAYSAEFGRGGSSVTNVIYKSGTNKYHGTLSEYYQGSGLNAIDASAALTGTHDSGTCNLAPDFYPCKTRYDQHSYGFTVGGPIIKNKLFFFASTIWERYYGNETSTLFIPTALGDSQLQAYGSPNALLLLKYMGGLVGTVNPQDVATGIAGLPNVQMADFTRIVPQQSPDTQWNFKVDYLASQKDTISFRYLHDRSSFTPDWFADAESNLPNFETYQGGPSLNGAGVWTHTFSPTMVNEFRLSYGHFSYVFYPTAATAANPLYNQPGLAISNIPLFPLLGTSSGFPQGRSHKTWQGQDGLTITRGSHTLKVGADVAKLSVVDAVPIDVRGTITFSQGGGYTALGNFLDNYTGTSGQAVDLVYGSQYVTPTMWQSGYYVQDNWKMKPNLMVNLGVRYEYQTNPENLLQYPAVNLTLGGDPTFPTKVKVAQHYDHFAPRIGFAYTPRYGNSFFGDGKTVIRGGIGIFYDSIYTNIMDNSAATSPNAVDDAVYGSSIGGRGYSGATTIPTLLSPVQSPYATVESVANNLTNPRTTQWNFGIERELPANVLLSVAYVGSRGQKLLVNDDYNPFMGYDPVTFADNRFNPNRGEIAVRTNGGDSYYHGLEMKVERRFAKGLMLRSSYTFSKSIDDSSNIFVITGGSSYPQNVFDRAADRGLSAFNAKQRWASTWVYDVPGLRTSDNKFLNAMGYATRHWQWSGTFSLQSGLPQTVYNGVDANGDGHSGDDRPDLLNAGAPLYMIAASGVWYGDAPGTYYDWATNSKLTTAQLSGYHWLIPFGANGNVGRNSYIQPGSINLNFGINRMFPIPHHESQFVEMRVELYNPFNHPNEDGDPGLWSNNLSAILPASGADPNPGHVLDPYWAREGARNIRLMLKYQF